MNFANIDWKKYNARVLELESEGMSTSDAQSVVDAEIMKGN